MSKTNTVSPLRQRMIEDMAARKLNPHTQRGHIYSCKRFAAWLRRSPDTATPTRGGFPSDEAALKLLYLAIKNAGLRWRPPIQWTAAMGQFAIQFGERFPGA